MKYQFIKFNLTERGAVMNNIAAVGQFVGVIVPYDWEVSFTMKTKWE